MWVILPEIGPKSFEALKKRTPGGYLHWLQLFSTLLDWTICYLHIHVPGFVGVVPLAAAMLLAAPWK